MIRSAALDVHARTLRQCLVPGQFCKVLTWMHAILLYFVNSDSPRKRRALKGNENGRKIGLMSPGNVGNGSLRMR